MARVAKIVMRHAKLRNLGQMKLERRRRLEPAAKQSPSRLTTSAAKTGRCVISTADPHLAYDCSALALESLKFSLTKKDPICCCLEFVFNILCFAF